MTQLLTRLVYISRAVGPQTTTVTTQILETARAFNKSHNLTGVLCQGKGLYVQVLEGERTRCRTSLFGRCGFPTSHRCSRERARRRTPIFGRCGCPASH